MNDKLFVQKRPPGGWDGCCPAIEGSILGGRRCVKPDGHDDDCDFGELVEHVPQSRQLTLERTDATVLESEIDAAAGALSACWNDVPPKAQAQFVCLSFALSLVKRRLTKDGESI